MWPFKVEKKPRTPAEEQIELIRNILFPPTKVDEQYGEDGVLRKWQVDYSADMNLYAALIDLQEGHNDKAVHNTINDIQDRLIKVREILEEHMQLSKEADYIVVENLKEEIDVDSRE
jgi:hypothetical protein